jgi:hypothetical protein
VRNDNGLSVLGYVLVGLIVVTALTVLTCCVGMPLLGAAS